MPQRGVLARAREQASEQVVTRRCAHADRQVDRRAALSHRGVDPSARQIQHVAGLEDRVDARLGPCALGDGVAVPGPGLVGERMPVHRLVDRPALRTRDLDDEHVVGVVVRIEPA